MISKSFTFNIITPIIMSGADRRGVELRLASIKGILRWWFRFCYSVNVSNVRELKEIEDRVFGSTENSCLFYMRIVNNPQNTEYAYLCMNDRRKEQDGAKKDYSKIKRLSYSESQSFEISLKFLPHFNYQAELENSIMFLSLFGGLGARWRRGFGSVEVDKYKWEGNDLNSLVNFAQKVISNFKSSNKLSGFMNITNTKIYLLKPKNQFWNDWESAMNDLRDNFYRKIKGQLGIGRISYKPPNGEREVSPAIIQIKKVEDNHFGVVLIYEEWDKFNNFVSKIKTLTHFEIKEV